MAAPLLAALGGGAAVAGRFALMSAAKSGISGAVRGIGGIASAFSTLASAASNAASNDSDSTPEKKPKNDNVIFVNFGMAGQAARQKITGGANLPSVAKPANTNTSVKMPTEALLDTAIKYLISIDKTLKSQLQFEKTSYDQSVKDQREAIVESKPSFSFSDIKDKLSGLKSNVSEGAGFAGKALLGLGVLGTAAALIAGSLDQTELDALKQNIDRFKENFGWLADLAYYASAGYLGFKAGKGVGAVGAVLVASVLKETRAGEYLMSQLGLGGDNRSTTATPNTTNETSSPLQNFIESAGYYTGYSMLRSAVRSVYSWGRNTWTSLKSTAAWLWDSRFVRFVRTATSNPRTWARFLVWLETHGGRLGARVAARIATLIAVQVATTAAEGAVASTVVGAPIALIVAVVDKIIAGGFALWMLYDLYQLYKDFEEWNSANPENASTTTTNATRVAATTEAPATRTSAPGVASTTTTPGRVTSTNSNTNGQNKTITGVVEGGRGYTTVTYSDGTTERRGGTLPARTNNPGNIMDGPIARSHGSVGSSPSTNGPPVAVFPTPEAGFAAMDALLTSRYSNGPIGQTIEAWATDPSHPGKVIGTAGVDPNKRYTDFTPEEKTRFQQALAKVEGFYAAGSGPPMQNAALGMPNSTTAGGAIGSMINGGLEKFGELLGMLGSSIVRPGIARNFTPSTPDVSERISNESANLHNDIMFGIRSEESRRNIESPTMPATTPGVARPRGSVSSMDPNYQSLDVLARYLAHFRMAA